MEEYRDIYEMLTPRRNFRASDALRCRIGSTLISNTRRPNRMRRILSMTTSCVAAAILMLILIPTGVSAKEILTEALKSLHSARSVIMEVQVRTTPLENFKYISLSSDFVPHRVAVARTDSTFEWRVDKGGRVATGNGTEIHTWIDEYKIGWHFTGTQPADVLGFLSILLNPENILEKELENCLSENGADYSLSHKGDEIILTVKADPLGDFTNPYMLNNSIAESANVRRYVIDAESKRVKSVTVSILNKNKETAVLSISGIRYDMPLDCLAAHPADIRFMESEPQGLKGLDATEAAAAFLNALESWNTSILAKAVDMDVLETLYHDDLYGAKVDSIGNSFTSGNSGNTYVPYSIKMPNGGTKRHNLIMQHSSNGGWIVSGGL